MKKILLIAVFAALIKGFNSVAMAQEQEDQPLQELFQTEVVYPQEKGALQFTSAAISAKDFPKLSRLQLFSQLGLIFAQPLARASALDHPGKTVEWNSGMFVLWGRGALHERGQLEEECW